MNKNPNNESDNTSLTDRLAVAFLSAVTAFLTGLILWGLILMFTYADDTLVNSFKYILWFTLIMAVSGFLLLENLMLRIFSPLWKLIMLLFRGNHY